MPRPLGVQAVLYLELLQRDHHRSLLTVMAEALSQSWPRLTEWRLHARSDHPGQAFDTRTALCTYHQTLGRWTPTPNLNHPDVCRSSTLHIPHGASYFLSKDAWICSTSAQRPSCEIPLSLWGQLICLRGLSRSPASQNHKPLSNWLILIWGLSGSVLCGVESRPLPGALRHRSLNTSHPASSVDLERAMPSTGYRIVVSRKDAKRCSTKVQRPGRCKLSRRYQLTLESSS